jgi:N-acetylglutamate synthase-like GNAT family acetyltransferase
MSVTVREATNDDAAATCAVIRRSIVELCHLDHGGDDAFLARWLANKTVENVERWITQRRHFLVAEEDGTILGAAAMLESGKIILNYVSPDARFRGVSKALMQGLEDRASADGIAECCVESSQTALAFYQALGYARNSQNYNHPLTGSPAIVLAKQLRPPCSAA